MNWFIWALLSALFAGLTAILAKIGVAGVNANLATGIRTTGVLVFTMSIALASTNLAAMRRCSAGLDFPRIVRLGDGAFATQPFPRAAIRRGVARVDKFMKYSLVNPPATVYKILY